MELAHLASPDAAARYLAQVPSLLVVSDFDGTLAGHSDDRFNVPVDRAGIDALHSLAGLPHTVVAVLSGRKLDELARICPVDHPVLKVSSHGAEEEGVPIALTADQQCRLDLITAELEELCAGTDCFVEHKPFQRGLHYRPLKGTDAAERMRQAALAVNPHGAEVTDGKFIVEFSVAEATKGTWITQARRRWAPDATVFLGDDATDERGFRALGGCDVGIKVGPGETAAGLRLAGVAEVGGWLAELSGLRRRYAPGGTR